MTDEERKRLTIAFAIARADNEQIDESEMGLYLWGKYAADYLAQADAVISALSNPISDELAAALLLEAAR